MTRRNTFYGQASPTVPQVRLFSCAVVPGGMINLVEQIKAYDQRIKQMAERQYPEAAPLRTAYGVGPLTVLTFVLTLGDKPHFAEVVMWAAI